MQWSDTVARGGAFMFSVWLGVAGLSALEITHEETEGGGATTQATFSTEANTLRVKHLTWYPCCLALDVEAGIDGARLTITEIDNSPPCLCPTGPWTVAITLSDVPAGTYDVYLVSGSGYTFSTAAVAVPDPGGAVFVRGDADESGTILINDAILILQYLFGDGAIAACLDAVDVDDGGAIDIGDAVRILMYLFAQGPPPELPFPQPGSDPTGDDIRCEGTLELVTSEFLRGDVDGDGRVTIADGVAILNALLAGGSLDCPDAADVNDDGVVDMEDVTALSDPWFPHFVPTYGPDTTPDALGCGR